jgi:hypothetical protein
MRMQASRELLAGRPDVWAFLAEPHHLGDWYPGISGVLPDRRGSAAGARWKIVASNEPTLLRRTRAATAAGRTLATVTIEGPWLITYRRSLARRPVARLYALCQTAATL